MDYILTFHEHAGKGDPSHNSGLEAIHSLREIFGLDWEPDSRHPLRSRLAISSEPSYQWLIHFVRKLRELSKMPGHEPILVRLGNSYTFPSALSEMEFALKLKLRGHSCKYVPLESVPTPDLTAEFGNQPVDVEITSLNLPYEDDIVIGALSIVTTMSMQANCVSGGLYSRVPKLGEFKEIRMMAQERISLAKSEHKMVELNIPGLLMCYIAPNDLTLDIPQAWRGSFVMRTKSPTPKKDRLAHVILDKVKAQLSGTNSGVLIVYDRFSTPDEILKMFDEKEIELVVGAFKNLACVVLVCPFSAWDSLPPKREDKNGRSFVEYSLPDGEVERCVIWRNIMTDHQSVVESIIDCLMDSSGNLRKLFA